jgi:hypothetical protein
MREKERGRSRKGRRTGKRERKKTGGDLIFVVFYKLFSSFARTVSKHMPGFY